MPSHALAQGFWNITIVGVIIVLLVALAICVLHKYQCSLEKTIHTLHREQDIMKPWVNRGGPAQGGKR